MARKTIEFICQQCRKTFESAEYGQLMTCTHCGAKLQKVAQLGQLLEQWFYPRRWRADLHEPNQFYLLEKLWTANGQGVTLYEGIAPPHTNYDIFRNQVTRLVARGIDEDWIELEFPDDPLEENPVYQLKFNDADRFARAVEALFPEVDWDEQIEVPLPPEAATSEALPDPAESLPDPKAPTPIASRRARRG